MLLAFAAFFKPYKALKCSTLDRLIKQSVCVPTTWTWLYRGVCCCAGHETALTPQGVQLKSMTDTMRELNHQWVDILKVDIEGKEWDILGSLLQGTSPGIQATQLLIELHYPWAASEIQIWDSMEALALDNFRLFSVEPNMHGPDSSSFLELSYLKVSPDGHVCLPRGKTLENPIVPFGCLRSSLEV